MAKKLLPDPHTCRECYHSDLHRRASNPVIARCHKRGGERFPASVIMRCPFYKPRTEPEYIHEYPFNADIDWNSI